MSVLFSHMQDSAQLFLCERCLRLRNAQLVSAKIFVQTVRSTELKGGHDSNTDFKRLIEVGVSFPFFSAENRHVAYIKTCRPPILMYWIEVVLLPSVG